MLKKLLGAPRELLLRSFDGVFGGDDWRPLLDFVSPTFFDVVPLRTLLGQGRELVGNATDKAEREATRSEVAAALAGRQLAVELVPKLSPASGGASPDPATRGQRVLEIYFAQLYGADATLLDLREGTMAERGDGLEWAPGPYVLRWEPEFLGALRTLYRGFYGGDDAQFEEGLRALDLEGSRDLFQKHFGEDPGAVRFERAHFVATFHDVFVRCRDEGVTLHRNFLPLGIYLATLHEHLDALGGGPFDVRSAYERASRGAGAG